MTITREQGYAIEGGPEPKPAEDSPERLRERREALGLERGDSIFARASIYEGNIAHVEECTGFDPAGRSLDCCPNTRRCYAAALSAEEERRGAQLLADEEARAEAFHAEPDHLAYADSPVWDDGPMPMIEAIDAQQGGAS